MNDNEDATPLTPLALQRNNIQIQSMIPVGTTNITKKECSVW